MTRESMARDSMTRVAKVADIVEQQAVKELSAINASHQRQLEQLSQLEQFRSEYQAKLGLVADKGIDARQLHDYQLFMGKLNQAIDQQVEDIRVAETCAQAARESWFQASQRKSAVDSLLDKKYRALLRTWDKAEQSTMDENTLFRRFSTENL